MPGNVIGKMQALKNFRSYFFRGMAALLPTILTIWIFVQCYIFIQGKVSIHINRGLVRLILLMTGNWEEEFLVSFWVDGPGRITGFFVAIIGVCFIGAFLASVMGRTLWHFMEKNLMRVPLVRRVYPYIKQVTDFFLAKKSLEFSKVVAFEYPRRDAWSVGLVTGCGLKKVVNKVREDIYTVFVPTSPTPFTGYVIMVPRRETIELEMSIEEALRFVISAGVITPAEHLAFEASRKEQEELKS
jgi:uncharacterized membrane protein